MDQGRAQPLYEFEGHSICTVSYPTREFEARYFASKQHALDYSRAHWQRIRCVCGRALHHQVYA
jgi:hypothetical protein